MTSRSRAVALGICLTVIIGCAGPAATGTPGATGTAASTTPGSHTPAAGSSGPAGSGPIPSDGQGPHATPSGGGPTPSGNAPTTPGPSPTTPGPAPTDTGTGSPAPTPVDAQVQAALARLTNDTDRVGQLLFVGWPGKTPGSVRSTLSELRPGGVIFLHNARTQARALAINQAIAQDADDLGILPPLRAIDHEGGSVQRIEDVPNLGSNLAFAQTDPTDQQACERGATHAEQLRGMDFDMDLAPVLDVVTNPDNTVIGDRSYGSDPDLVARLGSDYIQGLQGGGILAVGKHFPGHGATSVDSHLGLPILPFGMPRLERVELVPFVRAITPGTDVSTIMVGHIALPKIDASGAPASVSEPIVTGLLRDRLGFDGLVMTDDLGAMLAITQSYTAGEAAVKAIEAGVDMVLFVGDAQAESDARDALLAAVRSGSISQTRLMDALQHVLEAKARAGLLGPDEGSPAPTC